MSDDPLKQFLQRHAPQPVAPPTDLEERILRAARTPVPRQRAMRTPWLVAAGLVLMLAGGLGVWSRWYTPGAPVGEMAYEPPGEASPLFAVDPGTDLYEVRY